MMIICLKKGGMLGNWDYEVRFVELKLVCEFWLCYPRNTLHRWEAGVRLGAVVALRRCIQYCTVY